MNYLRNCATIAVNAKRCTGCGACLEVCPRNVLAITGHKAQVINRDACIECGACIMNCRFDALVVDSGVGCAAAMFNGLFKGDGSESCCDSDSGESCC